MFKEKRLNPGDSEELRIPAGKTTHEVHIPENLIESNSCKKLPVKLYKAKKKVLYGPDRPLFSIVGFCFCFCFVFIFF